MKRLRNFGEMALALLRELADETAYRRSLEATGRPHSPNPGASSPKSVTAIQPPAPSAARSSGAGRGARVCRPPFR